KSLSGSTERNLQLSLVPIGLLVFSSPKIKHSFLNVQLLFAKHSSVFVFLVVTTNHPAVEGVVNLLAFTRDYISFASQVSKVETVRPYNMFADAVKGLYLYGSKVMQPKAGAVLKAAAI
ncbi:MAG TPA: hypothetical protein V6C99_05185, partial [Oculatellaceae cyanobacterium]